ncbi:hypothetical protein Rs2_38140 [Raphanus sativus]|nr:hypothetical protein Rs2_38140 [Raphanus sativus]
MYLCDFNFKLKLEALDNSLGVKEVCFFPTRKFSPTAYQSVHNSRTNSLRFIIPASSDCFFKARFPNHSFIKEETTSCIVIRFVGKGEQQRTVVRWPHVHVLYIRSWEQLEPFIIPEAPIKATLDPNIVSPPSPRQHVTSRSNYFDLTVLH